MIFDLSIKSVSRSTVEDTGPCPLPMYPLHAKKLRIADRVLIALPKGCTIEVQQRHLYNFYHCIYTFRNACAGYICISSSCVGFHYVTVRTVHKGKLSMVCLSETTRCDFHDRHVSVRSLTFS